MNIDVIDMEDPVLGQHRLDRLNARGAVSEKLIMYGMSNGVGQMIADIIRIAPVGGIEILRIWGHGRSGGQSISGGHAGEEGRRLHWTGISVANIDAMHDQLAELAPYFAHGARVELRGCSVAEGDDGEALLQRLATIWGARVQAGTLTQYSAWTGPVHESSPTGQMCSREGIEPPP